MKETATAPVRVLPSTRARLKIRAARENTSLAKLIDILSKMK